MIDVVFPLSAALLTYLLVIPTATFVADRVLRHRRASCRHVTELGSLAVWLLLVAPVVIPVAWVLCGGVHITGGLHAVTACLTWHTAKECSEALILTALLLTPLIVASLRHVDLTPVRTSDRFSGVPLARRHGVRGLVCTRGVLRPVIELDECLRTQLSPDELDAVLRHEAAHARARDPLMFWLLRLCLAVNPARALLARHAAAWKFAREVRCDLQAVDDGSDRFVLARALVRVAGATRGTGPHCHFVGAVEKLDLRVRVLCAEELPARGIERVAAPLAVLAIVLLAAHSADHVVLDWLHHGSEHLWLNLFR